MLPLKYFRGVLKYSVICSIIYKTLEFEKSQFKFFSFEFIMEAQTVQAYFEAHNL